MVKNVYDVSEPVILMANDWCAFDVKSQELSNIFMIESRHSVLKIVGP